MRERLGRVLLDAGGMLSTSDAETLSPLISDELSVLIDFSSSL